MKDTHTIIAHLLAADDHPPLSREPEFIKAREALEADPQLQEAYEEAKQFHEQHPVLIRTDEMPQDVRNRIRKELERKMPLITTTRIEMELSPWTVRTQFAWAALLVLLLAGMSVLSSLVLDQQHSQEMEVAYRNQPPQDAFRSYVGKTVQDMPFLEFKSRDTTELVSWMHENKSPAVSAPTQLMDETGIGCANLKGPNGTVSLMCFKVQGKIVHLFITDNETVDVSDVQPAVKMKIQQREAVQWNDAAHTYLLITHDKRQELPEIFL